MKITSVILIVFLSLIEIHAQDQIKQGVYSLGGSIGYGSSSYGSGSFTSDNTQFYFAPRGSYFIVDQLELSCGAGYSYQVSTYGNYPDSKWIRLSLEFGARYYFPVGTVAPFIGADGSLDRSSMDGSPYSSQTNYSFIGGLEVFISKTAALEPAIKYEHRQMTDQYHNNDFTISIGVKYFILP